MMKSGSDADFSPWRNIKVTVKILIIEDEPQIAKHITGFFQREGWLVVTAYDGEQGLFMAKEEQPDLVILDLMLPKLPGLEAFKKIRSFSDVPVIMLTAKAEEIDKLLGLELGADDYMTKPFSLAELVARVKAILRRRRRQIMDDANLSVNHDIIRQGDFKLDLNRHQAYQKEKLLELTPTEFKLLQLMCQNPHRVFSRSQLVNHVLGHYYTGFDRTMDTHISNLRKKIEEQPGNPRFLGTVHGVGYRFDPEGKDEK
jgi:two-component system OmpR family response regulator